MVERGQTLHDYVAGISVFVITITVVLGFLPSIMAPYQGGSSAAHTAQADRIGDTLVTNLSVDGRPNQLNATELSALMDKNATELTARYGLAERRHVNISLVRLNGSDILTDGAGGTGDPLTAGDMAFDEDASSTARVVTTTNATANPPNVDCSPACRLVAKVW